LLNGQPFADSQTSLLFTNNAVLHPFHFDENGREVGGEHVMTANNETGRVDDLTSG
jgi:hypothetical protein